MAESLRIAHCAVQMSADDLTRLSSLRPIFDFRRTDDVRAPKKSFC